VIRTRYLVLVVATAVMLIIGGCAWVKPTPAGKDIVEASPDAVTSCQHLGVIGATTKDRVVLKRNAEVIRNEQVTLARNQAATMGGDTIVAKGTTVGPTLEFDVYRCR
jgi:hypothetical protein